jgi:UrcA family protein
MKTLALAAATLGLAFTATPAFAGPTDLPTMSVNTAGLDLNTAEGQRLLDERIERAARDVCQVNYVRTGTRIRSTEARECVAKARASAQQQMATIAENQQRGG